MDNQEIQNKDLKYEKIKVSDLVPYARNSRTHTDEDVDKLAGLIREVGFINPVVVYKDNTILAGHLRVLAAKKLGLEYVPCLRADYLTELKSNQYKGE